MPKQGREVQGEAQGGRIFFSDAGRTMELEDEIELTSAGIDIGSSTSHLVFSRLRLERRDNRYLVISRQAFFESEILLTPYSGGEEIDAMRLDAFLREQYRRAGIDPDKIDSGALILTGVAVRRRNARAIGELFARFAGKLVAVSAGDTLETVMAAHGSGAVARSVGKGAAVMNVDIGGGTAKLAVCAGGKVVAQTAIDIGARLICLDEQGRVSRIEEAGRRFAAALGITLTPGGTLEQARMARIASLMADRLFEAMQGGEPRIDGADLLRTAPLSWSGPIAELCFSGGVSEFIYGREAGTFGDLGPLLAQEVRKRAEAWGPKLQEPAAGIRATVIGASQYTVQVSGSTIFVSPLDVLPLRDIAVIAPDLPLDDERVESAEVAQAVLAALRRFELDGGEKPVALFVPWRGRALFHRLDGLCRGIVEGLAPVLAQGHPLVLAGESDIGGVIGIHFREELKIPNAVVSIDGIDLQDFDYIDIGEMLASSGAVPVVIKSLIFPASAAIGRAETVA